MKISKAIRLLAIILAVVAIIGCAGNDISKETRTVMEENLKIMEEFIESVQGTEDSQSYLSALQKMKKDMLELIPKMNELDKKYPDLFKLNEKKEPTSELKGILKELLEREAEVRPRFVAALKKVMKNASDPEIKNELQEIFELQKRMIN